MTNEKIPSRDECIEILNKNNTPSNVIEHSEKVCEVAEDIAKKLSKKGLQINKELVIAAALLHDIERAKDNHVIVGVNLLKSIGFPEVSKVVRKHGLYRTEDEDSKPKTIEEKILFYADKRVKGNKVVSLAERIKDLKKRYKRDFSKEFEFCKKIEEELIG